MGINKWIRPPLFFGRDFNPLAKLLLLRTSVPYCSYCSIALLLLPTDHDQFHKSLSNHPQLKPKNTRDVEHYHAQHPVSH